eukprot:26408-Lingulodinium_polyedra.AAC.1
MGSSECRGIIAGGEYSQGGSTRSQTTWLACGKRGKWTVLGLLLTSLSSSWTGAPVMRPSSWRS